MAGANPNNPNGVEKGFQDALSKFKVRLSAREYTSFKFATLKDLRQEILRIQAKQALKSECMNLTRVEAFVEGFRQFGEVVEVFLNTSEFVALVWGPMKFMLQVASNYTEAFDTLLSAYEEIAECLPLVEQYRALFSSNGSNAHMDDALAKIYGDILDFHSRALRFFNLPTWRQVFRSVWKDFNSRFGHILRDLRRHKELIESQATALQFQQYQEDRQLSFEKLDLLEKASVPCQRSWRTIHAQTQEQYTAVLQWFCAADSVLDHQDISKTRQEFQGTGTWILKHPKYSAWKTDDVPNVSTLWLNGIPGAGKTVLASTIIEDCREQKVAKTTFFYCKHEDPQRTTFMAVLKAILSQLLRWDDDLLPWCYEKFLTSGQLILSSETLCKELLHALLLSAPKTFIIIDGLDECNRSDWKPLLNFLAETVNVCDVQVPGKLRVMIISQNEDNIRNNLRTFSEIALKANDNELDIQKYVQGWCRKIQDKFELEDEETDYICQSTCYRANGMFLFAKLVMENLHNQISLADLRREIQPDNFPAGLEQAYARIVDRVHHTPNPAEHSLAEKVLGWMTCARRPLKWHEIQAAISTDISDQSVDFAERKSRVHVREICGSLINLISNDRIELVHSTAKYYLVQNGFVKRLRTECFLSALCLQYLTFPCFDLDLSEDTRSEYLRQGYFSFQDYAAAHWSDHFFAMVKAGPDVLRGEASDVEDEVNAAITDFVAYYQLHQHVREEENHIVQWYGRFQGFPFFDDLCHIVRHIQQHQAKGHEGLDEIGPSPLKGAVEASRAILEKLATSNALEANVMYDLVSFYGQNWYKCPKATCFYFHEGFSNDKSRETHIARHERPFRCPFQDCESGYKLGFIRRKELEKHMTVLHPENGKIVPRFFRLKRARDKAEDSESGSTSQSRAKNPATFACHQCTKKFTRNRNLHSHLLAHKAEKPYGCPMCDMRFARDSDRKRHEKLHTGEKNFVCKGRLEDGREMWPGANWGCGKAFPRAEALNNHFRSEAGKACLKSLLEAYLNEDMLEEHLMHQTEQELPDLSGFSLPRAVIEQYPELERFSSGRSIQMSSGTYEEGGFSESQSKKDGFPRRLVEWSIGEMDNIAPRRESSPTPTQLEREASPMMI